MVMYYCNELAGTSDGLSQSAAFGLVAPWGAVQGARVRRFRATITLASQAAGSQFLLANVPPSHSLCFGHVVSDTTLGDATVQVGTSEDSDAYLAASAVASANTPVQFAPVAQTSADPTSSDTIVYLTTGAAALPASGTLVVDLFYSTT